MSKSISVETFVDIDLEDIDTEDLIEELEDRGHKLSGVAESLIWSIYEKRALSEDYRQDLDELIYWSIGRIQ
jgi:hypothetical protein